MRKLPFPHLVDVKITEYCNLGCSFCYQSSTTEGKHASLDICKKYLDLLSDVGVFEVVLGGGEPTQHPDIVSILEYARYKDFIVGFTTKNYNLLNHTDCDKILQTANTFAISCQSIKDIQKASLIIEYAKKFNIVPYIQFILGLSKADYLESLLQECVKLQIKNITLLGYKNFGFGEEYPSKYLDIQWLDLVFKYKQELNVGIDTVVVSRYYDELIQRVDPRLLLKEEGKFSCYLDFVQEKMSPSSFTDKKTDIPYNSKTFKELFYTY